MSQTSFPSHTDVLVVGAGISGLCIAAALEDAGLGYVLLEARDRTGGRVLSESTRDDAAFDLGPAWFWPHQRRMLALIESLQLASDVFEQWTAGEGVYEDAQGNVRQGVPGIAMAGSYRLAGGLRRLVQALVANIATDRLHTSSAVTRIEKVGESIHTHVQRGDTSAVIVSKHIVLAMPGRVALNNIEFEPAFATPREKTLNGLATWMAGHAKLVAVYDHAFWRDAGLSGDAVSQRGPLAEIHDASPRDEGAALFGFVGIPAEHRRGQEALVKQAALDQLGRLFGEPATRPSEVFYQDWAQEPFTATPLDQGASGGHPVPVPFESVEPQWRGGLIWAGTESVSGAEHNYGYLEGAVESAHTAVAFLKASLA